MAAYPVLTLPTEIVVEIFLRYLPPYPICPPLLRYIAFNTPALWRAIELFSTFPAGMTPEAQIHAAQIWLKRSQPWPISLVLNGFKLAWASDELLNVMPMLLTHHLRWEHVALDLNKVPRLHWHRFDALLKMPMLVELDINNKSWSFWRIVEPFDAPKLTTLFVEFWNSAELLPADELAASVRGASLTRLYLNYVTPYVAAKILRETNRLSAL
uniref:F-box domain-containing protein n=1 Tax=Mycena chlorophos TaxID=658473 RepID=A0ABQ0M4B6_MYCCL|nr:predicted protein [Mycena chlorophos]